MDVLKYFISTLKEAPELHDPEAEEPAINALLIDDIKGSLDAILAKLDIIDFLIDMLKEPAEDYPISCDIPSNAILEWICDQILVLADEIQDEFDFLEMNPLGNITVLFQWFKPYLDVSLNYYLKELGAQRYQSIINSKTCNNQIHGLKGCIRWMERLGAYVIRFYIQRVRTFADRPEFN